MAAADLAKKAGGEALSRIGNIEKAVIEIIDARGRDLKREEGIPATGGGGLGAGSLNLDDTFMDVSGWENAVSELAGAPAVSLQGATRKRYTVQFNPSSLSLRARGEGFMPITSYGEDKAQVKPGRQSVRVAFHVNLVFDQVYPVDAFMEARQDISPTNIGTGIAQSAMLMSGKSEISVQQTVEGFIAAVRSPYTRNITFHWGSMNYSGVLNNVRAEYTMFNLQGQPIRANLDLSLICVDKTVTNTYLGTWQKAYDEAFGADALNAANAAQSVSNVFNVSF